MGRKKIEITNAHSSGVVKPVEATPAEVKPVEPWDPLAGTWEVKGVPIGRYIGKFVGAEYLPVKDPDPMTGKGGRQWAMIKFIFEISEGDYAGCYISREVPATRTPNSYFAEWVAALTGEKVSANGFNLKGCISKKYLCDYAVKKDDWLHVNSIILCPNQ